MELPEIEVPGGSNGVIDFAASLKFTDLALGQKLASDFLSDRDIVLLLVAEVGVTALGVGTSVDLRLPFYFNDTQKMPDPNGEQAVSLASAKFLNNDEQTLKLDIDMRVNGSDRFVANVPPLNIDLLYTINEEDANAAGGTVGDTRVVAKVQSGATEFKEGWNLIAAPTTVDAANVTHTAHAFKRFMAQLPLSVAARGGGGNPACWLQRFLDGMLIERVLEPTPSDGAPLYNKVALTVNALTATSLEAGVNLDLAKDLNVEGEVPGIRVGVFDGRDIKSRHLLMAANVSGLTLAPGPNQFALSLAMHNNDATVDIVTGIANGVPVELSMQLVGTDVLSRIAQQYYVAAPFNGYVDPFATLTPPPTPPPPPPPAGSEGGLQRLSITSANSDVVRIELDFLLPAQYALTWDPPSYLVNMAPAAPAGAATHGSFAIDAAFNERLFSSAIELKIWNYEDAARTVNSIANGAFYQLLVRGDGLPANDVIATFLASLKPITVSDAEDPTSVNRMEAAERAMGDSFELLAIEALGLDASGNWGLGEVRFGAAITGEVEFAIVPPPQISMLFMPPANSEAAMAAGAGGTLKLMDLELRKFVGRDNAYKAELAVSVRERQHTDAALNELLRENGLQLEFTGTSTDNTLIAKLLRHVKYPLTISPPKPGEAPPPGAPVEASATEALLFGMKYVSSSPNFVTIATDFDVNLPMPMPIILGDLGVNVEYKGAAIIRISVPNLTLVPGTNSIKLEVTITAEQNRPMLEEGLSYAVFPPGVSFLSISGGCR